MKWAVVIWRWIVRPLGLGVVTTIAVAWGLAAWLPQRGWMAREYQLEAARQSEWGGMLVTQCETFGASRRVWKYVYKSGDCFPWFIEGIDAVPANPNRVATAEQLGLEWGDVARACAFEGPEMGCEHATGWPLLVGWYSMAFSRTGKVEVRDGIAISVSPDVTNVAQTRALPLRPLWRGLLIDSAVFAGVWWAALDLAGLVRRASRRRRDCCVKCGYDRRGLDAAAVCPECGSAA